MEIKIKKFKKPVEGSWGDLQEIMDLAEQTLISEINTWKNKLDIKIISITPVRNAHMGDFSEERYVELSVVYEV